MEGQVLDTEPLLGPGLTDRSDLDIILGGGEGLEVWLRSPPHHAGLGEAGLGGGGEGGELGLGPGSGQRDTLLSADLTEGHKSVLLINLLTHRLLLSELLRLDKLTGPRLLLLLLLWLLLKKLLLQGKLLELSI